MCRRRSLTHSKEEVQRLVAAIDEDANGEIGFDEFTKARARACWSAESGSTARVCERACVRHRRRAHGASRRGQVVTSETKDAFQPMKAMFALFQEGKIGDASISLHVIIAAYRRFTVSGAATVPGAANQPRSRSCCGD